MSEAPKVKNVTQSICLSFPSIRIEYTNLYIFLYYMNFFL